MICEVCGLDLNEKAYFLGSRICYRCIYNAKIEKINNINKSIKLVKHCKECKTVLPSNRWAFCGKECAKIGKKKSDALFKSMYRLNVGGYTWDFKYGSRTR